MAEGERHRGRRAPGQRRSRDLVDAILDGAARLLARDTAGDDDRITTNRIADVAGVSIGSLYQYFRGKESVFAALVRRRLRETHEELLAELERAQGLPLEEVVRRLVDRILALKAPNTRVDSALFRVALRLGLDEDSFAFDAEYVERFAAALESFKPRVRPDLPADIAAHLLFHGLRAVMVVGMREDDGRMSDPRFRRELERLLIGYLRPAAPPERE